MVSDQVAKVRRFTREPDGMAKASSTPAMVECTPDIYTQYHNRAPTSIYGSSEYTCPLFMATSTASTTPAASSHAGEGLWP